MGSNRGNFPITFAVLARAGADLNGHSHLRHLGKGGWDKAEDAVAILERNGHHGLAGQNVFAELIVNGGNDTGDGGDERDGGRTTSPRGISGTGDDDIGDALPGVDLLEGADDKIAEQTCFGAGHVGLNDFSVACESEGAGHILPSPCRGQADDQESDRVHDLRTHEAPALSRGNTDRLIEIRQLRAFFVFVVVRHFKSPVYYARHHIEYLICPSVANCNVHRAFRRGEKVLEVCARLSKTNRP